MKILNRIILSLMLLSSFALANVVGTITALKGSASIDRDGSNIVAALGAKLNEKDTIKTEDKSKVQVIFNDETIITIGKNSNFSISEYLFEESKTAVAKFGLFSGAMRTITGKIGKVAPDKFSVATKTALIGIRGTNFTILAAEDGTTQVFCTFGAISVTVSGEVSTVSQGFYVVVSSDGTKGAPIKFTPKELNQMRSDTFTENQDEKEEKSSELKEATGAVSSSDVDTPIDGTTVDHSTILVSDISDSATDSAQSSETTSREDSDIQDETTPPEDSDPYKILFEGVTTNNDFANNNGYNYGHAIIVNNISVPGYIIGKMVVLESQNFSDDNYPIGLEFYGALSNQATNNFDVKFTGVYGWDSLGRSETNLGTGNINVTLINDSQSNYIRTTQDDLSANDSMFWGDWSTYVRYDDSAETPIESKQDGLWIMGESTPLSIIESYRTSKMEAHYDGIYKTNSYLVGGDLKSESGVANMYVDFGAGTASLSIYHPTETMEWEHYIMSLGGTYLQGNGTNDSSSLAEGKFFGADGKSVGGSFTINNDSMPVSKGVYEVTTPSISVKQISNGSVD